MPLCAFLCQAHTQAAIQCHHAPVKMLIAHLRIHTHTHTEQEVSGAGYMHLMLACRCHSPLFPASQLPSHISGSLSLPCPPAKRRLFLSQPFLFTHLCACAATTGRLLEGGGLSPWFATGSLWPSWPLWVSELPFCLNSCTGATAAASALCPVAGSAPFPKASRGRMGNERGELFLNILTQKTLQIYKFVFSVPLQLRVLKSLFFKTNLLLYLKMVCGFFSPMSLSEKRDTVP